jgi:hypothetical protein
LPPAQAEQPQLAPGFERLHRKRQRIAFAIEAGGLGPDQRIGAAPRQRLAGIVLRVH